MSVSADHLPSAGGRSARLDRCLADLLAQAPELEAAAVVSFDGLAMASALPASMDEDRVAAMSAALLSLGEKAAQGLGRGDLSQVYVEGEQGTVFLVSALDEAVLVAVAAKDAKAGLMLYEVRRAAVAVGTVLQDDLPAEPAYEPPDLSYAEPSAPPPHESALAPSAPFEPSAPQPSAPQPSAPQPHAPHQHAPHEYEPAPQQPPAPQPPPTPHQLAPAAHHAEPPSGPQQPYGQHVGQTDRDEPGEQRPAEGGRTAVFVANGEPERAEPHPAPPVGVWSPYPVTTAVS